MTCLRITFLLAALTLIAGCPEKLEDPEGGEPAVAPQEPVVLTNPMLLFDLQAVPAEEPWGAPACVEEGVEIANYVVGTQGSDVVAMLELLKADKRAEIAVPDVQGDLTMNVTTQWIDAPDLDGNGQADRLLVRQVVVPRLGEVTTSAWIVAVMADDAGATGPDQEKEAVLIDAVLVDGEACPMAVVSVGEDGVVTYDRPGEGDAWSRNTATPRTVTDAEKRAADAARDVALVQSAMVAYDTGVLAPETAYVKAFIRKEFLAEVEAAEPTRDLVFPEILLPLYGSLKLVDARMQDEAVAQAYAAGEPHVAVMVSMLVHEGDLRLSLSADELKRRVAGLQELGTQFEALEAELGLDGEKVRRRDFESKLGEVETAEDRAAVAKAYQESFRPMVAEDGLYPKFIDEMNAIARAHGFENYPDMRMTEKFGVDLQGYYAWTDQAWADTEADAKAFIESLKQFAGAETLTYWQVGQLTDAWILDQVGMEALPDLSEADAQEVMKAFYKDVGLDMDADPYDRITMDWYQDDLKWNRSGTAATATPQQAYFTSNILPGVPIPLDEWETPVHETGHTLHYQTSGAAAPGLSAYQNNMPSYVAEGVAMTFEEVPIFNGTLMRRYFGGKEGFTDKLFDVYPQVKAQAVAWQTRRLLNMGMYEVNLYIDRNPDGSERPWAERVATWDENVRTRLFVEPPADSLAQIMCRSHPFNDQSQLGYSSYSLGHALVRNVLYSAVSEGTDEELVRFGDAMKTIMAQGALADRASVQAVIDELKGTTP